jgi:hypothetical protein
MVVVNGDPRGRRRRHGKFARSASMAGGSWSNSVLEEEVTTVSLFLDLDGDRSGLEVAGHDEQSWRGGERSRALVGWHEGEGNARRVPLRATREQVRTSPRGWWPPVAYGHRCVTARGATCACASDRCGRLSGVYD